MVLLWTQHEGERGEPQPTDVIAQEHCKGEGREGKESFKGEASGSKTSPSKPDEGNLKSEKHVVSLRQVSEILGSTKRNVCVSPSVSFSSTPPSSSSSFSGSPSPPPPSSSTIPSAATPSLAVEEVKVERTDTATAKVEGASRVSISKTSTLGPALRLVEEEDEEEGEDDCKRKSKKKTSKKKFYTLPRNWRSKAADFILTKGRTGSHGGERVKLQTSLSRRPLCRAEGQRKGFYWTKWLSASLFPSLPPCSNLTLPS